MWRLGEKMELATRLRVVSDLTSSARIPSIPVRFNSNSAVGCVGVTNLYPSVIETRPYS